MNLVDPCDPPADFTVANLVDQVYTISDDDYPDYEHDRFVADPAFCPVQYFYSISRLPDDSSAITQSGVRTFEFFYNQEIDDIDSVSQTVTITSRTGSYYDSADTSRLFKVGQFELTFLDPCLDSEYVTFSSPT